MHLGHHVLAVDDDGRVPQSAQRHVQREPRLFAVGPSRLLWTGQGFSLVGWNDGSHLDGLAPTQTQA
jgi:hypothetical protein